MSAKRILYVEDNFQNRRLVKKILTAKGYQVIEAEEAIKGIALAESERPDLILMDINLPGIDGMEATARLKSSPELKSIPIVALTANAMRGDRERIMAAGCDDYMQKPINNVKLVEIVAKYLGETTSPKKPVGFSTAAPVSKSAAVQPVHPAPAPVVPSTEATSVNKPAAVQPVHTAPGPVVPSTEATSANSGCTTRPG